MAMSYTSILFALTVWLTFTLNVESHGLAFHSEAGTSVQGERALLVRNGEHFPENEAEYSGWPVFLGDRPPESLKDLISISYRRRRYGAHHRTRRAIPSSADDLMDIPAGLSQQCAYDLNVYNSALIQAKGWAIRVADAQAVQPSGVLLGNGQWLGDYEECVDTKATNEVVWMYYEGQLVQASHNFDSRYCKIYYTVPGAELSYGMCVPSTCNTEDATKVFEAENRTVDRAECGEKKPKLGEDGAAIVAIVVLCIFLVIITVATTFDVIKELRKKETNTYVAAKTGQSNPGYISETGNSAHDETLSSAATFSNGDQPGVTIKFRGNTESAEPISEGGGNVRVEISGEANESKGEEEGKLVQSLVSFSLVRNVPAMMSANAGRGSYMCMHGIRFLSMAWIVLGHTWQLVIQVTSTPRNQVTDNILTLYQNFTPRFSHQAINNMSLSVESFFLLSGALVTISFLKQLTRLQTQFQETIVAGGARAKAVLKTLGLYVFHRYWRLTPVYAILLMSYVGFWYYMGEGPLWPETYPDVNNCHATWWTNLLYINNLVMVEQGCMGYTWYLANDFQFHLIVPLFAFFLFKFRVCGIIFLCLGFVGHLSIRCVLFSLQYTPGTDASKDPGFWYWAIYIKPWARFGSYCIGIALGYIMFTTKCKLRIHWGFRVLGWILAAGLCMTAVYARAETGAAKVALETCKRNIFALGVAWIVFACCSGYGGIINIILSWKLFIPLGRLTYVGYLVHPLIIYYYYYSRKRLIHVEDFTMALYYCGFLMLTIPLSFAVSVCFEVPFGNLEKVILPRSDNKKK